MSVNEPIGRRLGNASGGGSRKEDTSASTMQVSYPADLFAFGLGYKTKLHLRERQDLYIPDLFSKSSSLTFSMALVIHHLHVSQSKRLDPADPAL